MMGGAFEHAVESVVAGREIVSFNRERNVLEAQQRSHEQALERAAYEEERRRLQQLRGSLATRRARSGSSGTPLDSGSGAALLRAMLEGTYRELQETRNIDRQKARTRAFSNRRSLLSLTRRRDKQYGKLFKSLGKFTESVANSANQGSSSGGGSSGGASGGASGA